MHKGVESNKLCLSNTHFIRLIQIAAENGPAVIIDFKAMGAASIEAI